MRKHLRKIWSSRTDSQTDRTQMQNNEISQINNKNNNNKNNKNNNNKNGQNKNGQNKNGQNKNIKKMWKLWKRKKI